MPAENEIVEAFTTKRIEVQQPHVVAVGRGITKLEIEHRVAFGRGLRL